MGSARKGVGRESLNRDTGKTRLAAEEKTLLDTKTIESN